MVLLTHIKKLSAVFFVDLARFCLTCWKEFELLEGGLVASAGQLATAAVREAGRDKKLRGDETRRRMEGPGAAADELRVGEEGGQYICALFIIVFQLKSRVAPSAPATAVTASSSARLSADAVAVHDWCRMLRSTVMITSVDLLVMDGAPRRACTPLRAARTRGVHARRALFLPQPSMRQRDPHGLPDQS